MSAPSQEVGMGAIVRPNGITFRVWAPHAQSVAVVGSFNSWKAVAADRLADEGNGFWSIDSDRAHVGDEYRYEIKNGKTFTRIDPYARAVTSSNGNGIIYDPLAFHWKSEFTPPPLNDSVIYELHVGSFYHSGKKAEKAHPGTFEDAVKKLPYLKDLGINVIEVLPIHEFPGDLSWGYNPAHLFAVESAYGGPDGFKTLVDSAHKQGIAVILDVVYNHVGPDDCGIWRFDGWYEGEGGGIYFYQDERAWTPWTEGGRPDFGRDEVRQYLRDNAIMWLTEYRVDGLRIDSVSHIRNIHGNNESPEDDIPEGWTFLQWLTEEKNRLSEPKILIAEDLCCNESITNPTADGGVGADTQWDKNFCDVVRGILLVVEDHDRSMDALKSAIEQCYSGRATARVVYTESHDEAKQGLERVPKGIDPENPDSIQAASRASVGAVLALTSPGIPMLLQGQEFLEGRYFDSDQILDWNFMKKHDGILQLFKDIISLRANSTGVSRGLTGEQTRVYHVNEDSKVLAYIRADRGGKGDDVIVVVNLKNETWEDYRIGLPSNGTWKVRIDTADPKYLPQSEDAPKPEYGVVRTAADGFSYSAKVRLAPYSAIILSQDK